MEIDTTEHNQEDLDLARLYDKIERLIPLTKKYAKKMEAQMEFGAFDVTLTETRYDLLDLLFTFADDPEWLARCRAIHEEEKTSFAVRKRAYKNKK